MPVGQLSDPFRQSQEDEFGITISGLPGEQDEPDPSDEPEPADASASGDGDEEVVFDLDDWSDMERQAVTDRLREAAIPHMWAGTSLHVAPVDEAPVENILDMVEGESDDEEDLPPLDADRDQVAYDLSEWDDDHLDGLVAALRGAEIAYAWDGDELYVYGDDEEAVDELLEQVSHPDELAPEPDDGAGGAELLGEVFVAADRLQHDAADPQGVITMMEMSRTVDRRHAAVRVRPGRVGAPGRAGGGHRRAAVRGQGRRGRGDGAGRRPAHGAAAVRVSVRVRLVRVALPPAAAVILAELEVFHSRPIAPTRRVALGHVDLPVTPAPGFGGILLGGVVAAYMPGLDPDLVRRPRHADPPAGGRVPHPAAPAAAPAPDRPDRAAAQRAPAAGRGRGDGVRDRRQGFAGPPHPGGGVRRGRAAAAPAHPA